MEQGHKGIIYKASNFHLLGQSGGGRNLIVDGKKFHARSLNQKEKPYGRDLKRRWENKDGHSFWESKQDMYFVNTKPKNIYVYYLNIYKLFLIKLKKLFISLIFPPLTLKSAT